MATEIPVASRYTRNNPFPAKLVVNRSLCAEDSEKDTRHFELDLKGWGLNYEVGDSMTVWPTNDPAPRRTNATSATSIELAFRSFSGRRSSNDCTF